MVHADPPPADGWTAGEMIDRASQGGLDVFWIVGGKPYEFCCPPCVDEFVKMAKETPGDIKEPETYKKK